MRVQKNERGVYDFDALVIEPRVAVVGGLDVDVSMIPVAVTLRMAALHDRYAAFATKKELEAEIEHDPVGELEQMWQMVSDVCIVNNPKFTVEFLKNNLSYAKFTAFMKFVLRPINDKADEMLQALDKPESEEGNAEADETTSD